MSGYRKFCEPCERTVKPAADGDCPHCGAGLTRLPRTKTSRRRFLKRLTAPAGDPGAENPREKNDDDGLEYGHPRDRRDGLE